MRRTAIPGATATAKKWSGSWKRLSAPSRGVVLAAGSLRSRARATRSSPQISASSSRRSSASLDRMPTDGRPSCEMTDLAGGDRVVDAVGKRHAPTLGNAPTLKPVDHHLGQLHACAGGLGVAVDAGVHENKANVVCDMVSCREFMEVFERLLGKCICMHAGDLGDVVTARRAAVFFV